MQNSPEKTYWVYILHCENNSYYTGYTDNLEKRYAAHVDGTSRCKYTRAFKPLHIAQSWRVSEDKSLAMKIERHIKSLTRLQKEEVILHPNIIGDFFDLN